MKYQAILFDLDGTLLPMDEAEFVKCFYGLLVPYVTPPGKSHKEIALMLKQSLDHVIANDGSVTNEQAFINFYTAYGRDHGCRFDLDLIEEFERQTGYTVVYETFDSNETMYAMMESGAAVYDIVSVP